MSNLLIVLGPDETIRSANPATLKLLGYREAELLGKPFTHIYEREAVFEEETRLTRSEDDTGDANDVFFRTKDGRLVPISFVQSALRDAKGNFQGVVCVAQDITERRIVEAERLRDAMRYRALFEQTNDAVLLIDLKGGFIAVNQRTADMLGYAQHEFAHLPYENIIAPNERASSHEVMERLKRGETIPIYERNLLCRDGTTFPVEISIELVRDAEGNPLHVQSIARDITERKHTEQQLSYQANLLQNVSDAIISTDMQNHILSWNRAAEKVYGYKADEVIGRKLSEVVPTEFENGVEEFIKQQYLVRGHWRSEVKQRRRNGERLYLSSSVSVLRDGHGQMIGTVSVNHDITARKQAELDLEERMIQLAALRQVDVEVSSTLDIEHVIEVALNAAFILSGADAGFILMNEGDDLILKQGVGYYSDLPVGRGGFEAYGIVARALRDLQPQFVANVASDPDYVTDIPTTKSAITIPLISQEHITGILHLETDDGERFTPEMFDFLRILTTRIAVALDNARLYQVSQQQLAELTELYDRVLKLEQLKTDMIRIASHDLRNPVGVIKGYIELIRMDVYDRMNLQERDYVETIRRQINRIQDIISDILSLERIEQAALENVSECINLNEMVRHIVQQSSINADAKSQTVEVEVTADEVLVDGDPAQLHEALINLVDNAIKYTPDGGMVRVRLIHEGDTARFEVQDTGVGIRAEQQERLFQPFYRAKSEETVGIDGTGLGLHLVKNIVERHGGAMYFSSVYRQGSTFGFNLPLNRDAVGC